MKSSPEGQKSSTGFGSHSNLGMVQLSEAPKSNAGSGSQSHLGLAQIPEVVAAAQVLLQNQMQELGIAPEQVTPQL